MGASPGERSAQARMAAHISWAVTPSPSARTKPARDAFLARFEREVRERHPGLSDEEVQRMARSAMKAHMHKLALASAKARKR